eukprot:CAMPEP_0168496268 /NCGR_PEP_ID=MMETSP0228-20121227/72174_1 /TAXON_ID=133427 /ORGANISM="Protoceratium reticulatum, Strain CCCM 535 (=CCMP 1889)" /LENGTH=424 /DNA_ID=CAMNT_0008513131 /DNA_START=33 /DNA_END=1308 /DNA_ORIENTATION=-
MFQIWRAQLTRARWSHPPTELGGTDEEARTLHMHSSRTSAISFFASIEQLGVSPPPLEGWMPRDQPEDGEDRQSLDALALMPNTAGAEWWGNAETSDWIYHGGEDMYFHLPSNSLWERRESQCWVPDADGFTFCRVDMVHLKALLHFAQSIDTALLPLAWNAWVRHVRKRHHAAQQQAGAAGEGGSNSASKKSRTLAGEKRGNRFSFDKPQGRPPQLPPTPALAASGAVSAAAAGADLGGGKEAEPSAADAGAGVGSEPLKKDGAKALEVPTSSSKVFHATSSDEADLAWVAAGSAAAAFFFEATAADTGEYGAKHLIESAGSPSAPKTSSGRKAGSGVAAGLDSSTSTSATKLVDTEKLSGRDQMDPTATEASASVGKRTSDGMDRHMRRMEQFLADVKRNPQRLVAHVDRRRAEKTGVAYIV